MKILDNNNYLTNSYFSAPQSFIRFTMTNNCSDLSHLAIFDYKQWCETEDEESLYAWDVHFDDINAAFLPIEIPAAQTHLYVIRAYFDFSEELECIVYLPDYASLNLKIDRFGEGPYFSLSGPAMFKTQEQANMILNHSA